MIRKIQIRIVNPNREDLVLLAKLRDKKCRLKIMLNDEDNGKYNSDPDDYTYHDRDITLTQLSVQDDGLTFENYGLTRSKQTILDINFEKYFTNGDIKE